MLSEVLVLSLVTEVFVLGLVVEVLVFVLVMEVLVLGLVRDSFVLLTLVVPPAGSQGAPSAGAVGKTLL